jgi:hypothetical protein
MVIIEDGKGCLLDGAEIKSGGNNLPRRQRHDDGLYPHMARREHISRVQASGEVAPFL